MNANGEQLHQALGKLVNRLVDRVRSESADSLQTVEYLANILQALEHIKEPRSLGSDSLLSECLASSNDLNSDSNSELNNELHNELHSESTNESDSGQQSSEEGSTTNDLKESNDKRSLLELILQLLSIIVNHLAKQVNNTQDAKLLIEQWKHCLCFKQATGHQLTLSGGHHNPHHKNSQTNQFHGNGTGNCPATQQPENLLINANHPSLFVTSSGIQSDASCSPLSSLTADCCANNLSTCSLSPSCCYLANSKCANQQLLPKKCATNSNKTPETVFPANESKESGTTVPSAIPMAPPIPPPPPMPNLMLTNPLDKSMSNSSLNNQLLTSSLTSNLSASTPPQSINEVPVILLEAPKPKSKMKTLNWNRISVQKVLTSHKPNIWSKLFSKKDDSKKSKSADKEKKEKAKSRKSHKKSKHSSDEENTNSTEEDEFKNQRSAYKRVKKPDNNNNASTNSSINNLTKLNSTINASNSSINSTTTINSTSTRSKKQSEEDLHNIVQLDFDTLEGLFCQPNNNQVNSVGTMIANFSNINGAANNRSAPNSSPNSPATNRRLLNQQTNPAAAHLLKANYPLASGNQLNGQPLNAMIVQQSVGQLAGQLISHSTSPNSNQENLVGQSSQSANSVGQLTGKLNKLNKLEPNGRNSPSALNYFAAENAALDRKAALKRCSGEFNPAPDIMHNLLDTKRTLNINIFLKQFRSVCSNDGEIEIVRLVKQGDHAVFGAERLVHLIKLLPDQTEIDLLKAHSDDLSRLPLAERFLLRLIAIPKYKLRMECMLLKAEYEANFSYLNPSLDTLINAAKELENCRKLHEVLYLILIAGNFLNSGGYAGNSAGFKINSLLKLSEIRANKPGISLIHYVALQANKKQLSSFVNELSSVEKASKISLESLKCDINSLANKIFKLKQQINSTNDCSEYWRKASQEGDLNEKNNQDETSSTTMNHMFFEQMREFLSDAEKQIKQLTQKVETDLEQIRTQLGEFLCEELNEFKLEECFRIFSCFITKFKLALEENAKRKDEFKLINDSSKESDPQKAPFNSKFKQPNGKSNESNSNFNSLPRFKKTNNKLFNSSISNVSIMNLAEENDLHPCLVEFLTKANELNGNSSELFNGLSTFRRVGSGRRSFRQLNNVFANSEIDFSSRERLNTSCAKIAEEESNKKDDDDKLMDYDKEEELSGDELNDENSDRQSTTAEYSLNSKKESISSTAKSLNSFSSGNNEIMKPNTPMAVIQPTLYSSGGYSSHHNYPPASGYPPSNGGYSTASYQSSDYTSANYSPNSYTRKILERAQSQLSLNSIGKSKQVPIRSSPLTPLQSNINGSLKRLNSGSYGSSEFKNDYDDLKDFKDFEDLKESSMNLKTCIQSLESLNNITSSRYQSDKNSLNYHERTRSLSKHSNKSPLQSLNSYNSLKRGGSERHSFKYQVSSKVDCHNPIAANRNLYKENSSHVKDDLLDSCKYILPKTSPVLSTLNRASILRMSLNRKTAQEAKEAKSSGSLYHSSSKSPSTIRISTTARPIKEFPKKSSHYNSAYIEPTYIEVSGKTKSTNSLAAVRPSLSRVSSFRGASTLDRHYHQSRSTSRSSKALHSTSAHSNTRQPRWIC